MSSSSISSRSIAIGTTAACVAGLVGYAIYFDYKRRNSIEFRKDLRRQKKKVSHSKAKDSLENSTKQAYSDADLQEALKDLREETFPTSRASMEDYFQSHLDTGERLAMQGPQFHLQAAVEMYRALRVYPVPTELLTIFSQRVDKGVFDLILKLLSLDVKTRVEGYYDEFPPKDMNVSVTSRDIKTGESTLDKKNVLVASQDFKAGDIIYKETPIAVVLDEDLATSGTYCSHCLRKMIPGMLLKMNDDKLASTYCSRECQTSALQTYQKLLFSKELPFPETSELATANPQFLAKRAEAQTEFTQFLVGEGNKYRSNTLLIARLLACWVVDEVERVQKGMAGGPNGLLGSYSINDHLERLRFIDVQDDASKEAFSVTKKILEFAVPGTQDILMSDKFHNMLGKVMYNAIGVCYSGGRDDKLTGPTINQSARTPYGSERQVGSGIYWTSSYLSHSCVPNARPSFQDGTSRLTLIATRDIKKGEELTMSYVNTTQRDGETVIDARRRRRAKLATTWRFACPCSRCAEEQPASEHGRSQRYHDESKVEAVLKHVGNGVPTGETAEATID